MATKTKLKSTSSITPVVETPKDDNQPMLMPDAAVKALMQSAFDDGKASGALRERGSQRSVCAIMYHAAQLIYDGTVVYALRDAALGTAHGKDVRTKFNELMISYFVGAMPDTSDMSPDETTTATTLHTNHAMLIRRSIITAGVLEANGVVVTDFDHVNGRFTVPSKLLYPPDATPFDRLEDEMYIPLDGEAITYYGLTTKGKKKPIPARASIAQLLKVCGPEKKPRKPTVPGTPATTPSDAASTMPLPNFTNVEDVATRVPVEVLIAALHELWIVDGPAEPIARDTMSDKAWNMLSDIMQRIDESKMSWAKSVKKAA